MASGASRSTVLYCSTPTCFASGFQQAIHVQWEGVNKSLVTQWSDREVTSLLNSHHKHNPGQLCLFTLWSLCCPTEPNVKDGPQTSDSPYLVISVLSVRHPPLTHLSAKRMRGKQHPVQLTLRSTPAPTPPTTYAPFLLATNNTHHHSLEQIQLTKVQALWTGPYQHRLQSSTPTDPSTPVWLPFPGFPQPNLPVSHREPRVDVRGLMARTCWPLLVSVCQVLVPISQIGKQRTRRARDFLRASFFY